MLSAFVAGFALGSSLILAIGPQNAFVLRQGLRREHVLLVSLTCALSDAVLIAAGVGGFGVVVAAAPWIEPLFRYGGAAFLFAYGARSLRAAWCDDTALVPAMDEAAPRSTTLATCLALTWLNPHVYVDTLLLLGSVSTQYPRAGAFFGAGAIAASFVFFFGLAYGARLLRPLFARPEAWRVLELVVGVIMISIATGLILG